MVVKKEIIKIVIRFPLEYYKRIKEAALLNNCSINYLAVRGGVIEANRLLSHSGDFCYKKTECKTRF